MAPIDWCNRVFFTHGSATWQELQEEAISKFGEKLKSRRTIFAVSNERDALGAVSGGVSTELDFGVVETSRLDSDLKRSLAAQGVQLASLSGEIFPDVDQTEDRAEPGRISVLTSGTTGVPKLVPHSAQSLNTFDRVSQLESHCWFLPYQIGSYAWYQMVGLSLFVAGQDLWPANSTDLIGSFEAAISTGRVTAISSTPTFWRHALMSIGSDVLAKANLRSISMGGEIVDQAILDRLASLFPSASIRHIYASSEAGAAIVVTDGKPGFDAALLNAENGAVSLRIIDDRLHVVSRYGNTNAEGQWIDTGDLVEQQDDRVLFCGRADNQVINVGGQKAYPANIEAHLLSHPDVAWVQVEARRAPIMGYLPVASVVLNRSIDQFTAERLLTEYCEMHLADYAVPRIWNFLAEVPMRSSLKS